MQYRSILARLFGAIATRFFAWAEWLDPEWDSEWVRIRDAVRRRYAELDEGWNECTLPTMPCPPPVPEDDDGPTTVPRIEIAPPPPPYRPERRDYVTDEGIQSVHPPEGTFWVGGLLSRRSDPPPKGQA